MDESKQNLQGSENRDIFKRKHKDLCNNFYACDLDFCLIDKYPPGIVANLDYKTKKDKISFSETIAYNELMTIAPFYIVQGDDLETGEFVINRYLGGDPKPEPPAIELEYVTTVSNWVEFEEWEKQLRVEYRKRKGWNGNLRISKDAV